MNTINYSSPGRRSDQEAFDIAARHLLKQGSRSVWGEECVYRAPDGTRCALGALIPDEVYDLSLEGTPSVSLYERPDVAPYLPRNKVLATALQSVHDISFPDRWRSDLRRVAREFGLNAEVLDE
jgi:hypothetical protein